MRVKHRALLLALISMVARQAFAEEPPCEFTGQVPYLRARDLETVRLSQQIASLAATTDITSFCRWNRFDRLAEGHPHLQEYRRAKNQGDLKAAEEILLKSSADRFFSPWQSSLAGSPALKRTGPDSFFTEQGESKFSRERIARALDRASTQSKVSYEGSPAYSLPMAEKSQDRFCEKSGVKDQAECKRALNTLRHFARTKLSGPTVAGKNFSRILRDPAMKEGVLLAAKRALQFDAKGGKGQDHFFENLVQSYRDSGAGAAEAVDRAWDIAFLYSVGGPNFAPRANADLDIGKMSDKSPDYVNPIALGTQALIELLVDNDSQPEKNGKTIYSLPGGANFPCDLGKSYHFWMSGYFARYLIKMGFSADTASRVAYGAAVAYQLGEIDSSGLDLLGNVTGRQAPKDHARFGTIENGIRLDLNLAAAGAAFGASDGKRMGDLTAGFRHSLAKAGMDVNGPEADSAGEEGLFARLNPEAIFEYYRR